MVDNEEGEYLEAAMTPTEYELLTQTMYQLLIHEQGNTNVEVKHNTTVVGRSGARHQIDVYWEFQIGGKKYKTFIECKHYKNAVSIGHIRNFFGALHDTGANGIFVTKVGYQSGAQEFAKFYGIDTKLVKPAEESDLKNRVKKVVLNLRIKTLAKNPPPKINMVIASKDAAGIPINNEFLAEINAMDPHKTQQELGAGAHFRDLSGLPERENIGEWLPASVSILGKASGGPYTESLKLEDKYILVSGRLIKINELKVDYHIDEVVQTSETTDALEIYSHILKDFETGEIEFLKTKDEKA